MKIISKFGNIENSNKDLVYCCRFENEKIPEKIHLENLSQHKSGKSNDDVLAIQFFNCTVKKIPQGLTKIFPNMRILVIYNSKLKKISKSDLEEYKNLREFFCRHNKLEFVPGDLFEGFKNLRQIQISQKRFCIFEPNILDGLEKLQFVDFRNFRCCEKFYCDCSECVTQWTLQEVKDQIAEKFYVTGTKEVRKFVEKIQENSQNLKKSEVELKQQVLRLTEENQNLKDENRRMKVQHDNFDANSLFGDLKSHIQDENMKDFRIEIDGGNMPVHKVLLAARSPVLAEMLRNNPEAENLKLVDIPVEIFEAILKFLYTDELPQDDGTNFLHLFAAACRLKIKKLTDHAAMKILDQMNSENALAVLDLGNKHEHVELRQKAFEEIKQNNPKILFKDDWAEDTEKVKKIIGYFKKLEFLENKFQL